MKRIATFVMLLGLIGVFGCEDKKPPKVDTNAPPAGAAADQTMPPGDDTTAPADGDKPADGAPAGEKPADEAAK